MVGRGHTTALTAAATTTATRRKSEHNEDATRDGATMARTNKQTMARNVCVCVPSDSL